MAKFPQKAQMPTAITKHSRMDLSCTHVTTGNIMDFQVAKYMELVPKQRVKINHNVFARMDALNVPTYGDMSIHSRAYFVPYRTVFPAWNDFITDTMHTYSNNVSGLVPTVPLLKNSTFVQYFAGTYTDISTVVSDEREADIVRIKSDGTTSMYKLTPKGSRFLKLLYSLGYRIDFNSKNTEATYSALPLLCAAKVYIDWYFPGAYTQDLEATYVINWMKYDLGTKSGETHSFVDELNPDQLRHFCNLMDKVNYDSDYFTSAWDNPVSPNNNASSSVTIPDTTLLNATYKSKIDSNVTQPTTAGTPMLTGSSSSNPYNVSQFMITALKSLTDYLKRHQLAGSRALDRFLARFGVTLSSEKLNRSYYLSEYTNNQPVNIGDVTALSDTSKQGGEVLGGYAGKGISYGNGSNLEFETDEYGMLIIVSTIVPRVTYTQGQDRITMHKSRLDFFTPEFDNLGVQAIATKELFVPLDARQQYKSFTANSAGFDYSNLVFGFTPRFAEYKRGVDNLTGDYILNSRNSTLSAWTFNRDITPLVCVDGVSSLKHSRGFLLGDDSTQYNRIFNYVEEDVDHFFINHVFNIETYFPGASLFDTYEFEDEDKAQKVAVDVNGVKAN